MREQDEWVQGAALTVDRLHRVHTSPQGSVCRLVGVH